MSPSAVLGFDVRTVTAMGRAVKAGAPPSGASASAVVPKRESVRAAMLLRRKDRIESFMTSNLLLRVGTARGAFLGAMSAAFIGRAKTRPARHDWAFVVPSDGGTATNVGRRERHRSAALTVPAADSRIGRLV